MRTSATGISTSSRPHRAIGGFTLIEILVVLVIIGVLAAGTVLSVGVVGKDSALDRERDRITALLDYLREQATLQNREYGMRCFDGGYEFMVFDARTAQWQRLVDDTLTRARRLPPGLEIVLRIEGRDIVLPRARQGDSEATAELAPQIMLFSSGELNLFELTLRRDASGDAVRFAPARDSERIEVVTEGAGSA
jgi:general secretion pathway protein H